MATASMQVLALATLLILSLNGYGKIHNVVELYLIKYFNFFLLNKFFTQTIL